MTVLSDRSILQRRILTPCEPRGESNGMTYGLGPAGYDLRLDLGDRPLGASWPIDPGEFLLVAALEHFEMPGDVLGVVHDKSTLARRGLAVQNTVIEPGWRGFLTLELTNHSKEAIWLVQGQPICQVVFHLLDRPSERPYAGKYQDQEAGPVGPR